VINPETYNTQHSHETDFHAQAGFEPTISEADLPHTNFKHQAREY
jgi:hypothetical protein